MKKENTEKKNDSRISRNFITATAVVFFILIVTTALLFNWYMKKHSELLHDVIMDLNQDLLLGKIDLVMDRIEQDQTVAVSDIKKMIRDFCTEEKGFLYVVLYSKTSDDNFFKITDTVHINRNITLKLEKRSTVREVKEVNYLKKALHRSIVEPKIYSQESLHWQNVYAPLPVGRKSMVLQFLISVEKANEAVTAFNGSYRESRIVFSAVSAVLAIAVVILSLLFSHNFTLLITSLSLYMNKAASGDLDVNLKTTDDESLNQLAQSFNSLIDELKDRNDKTGADPYSEIFREGVARLKEDRLTEAVAIFTTLSMVRPEGFGSYFNLGVAHAKLKNFPTSMEMFKKALDLNPEYELTLRYIEKVQNLMAAHAT